MLLLPVGLMVPAAAAGTALLLDGIGAACVGAYGLRRLRGGYGGAAVRVRRSSDGTEQDVGFLSGGLDTAALLAFCGGGDGLVSRWYDQSERGQDAVQATVGQQPQLVAAGVVNVLATAAARPSPFFARASQQHLARTGFALGGTAYAAAFVGLERPSGGFPRVLSYFASGTDDYNSTSNVVFAYATNGELYGYQTVRMSGAALGTAAFQGFSVWTGAAHTMTLDGVAAAAVPASGALVPTAVLDIGYGGSEAWDGAIAEVIVVSGGLSAADQAAVRASQAAYYGTP